MKKQLKKEIKMKHCYENEIISKIILDNLNIFNDELVKLMENKKELNGEEKKQFKKDFTFIRKNIDNGIDEIDFKGFKKKLNEIHKKGDKGEDKIDNLKQSESLHFDNDSIFRSSNEKINKYGNEGLLEGINKKDGIRSNAMQEIMNKLHNK